MRARNLKPGFFKNDLLAEAGPVAMILFQGLWAMADRDGRLEDRPSRIKAEVVPYFKTDVPQLLDALAEREFIIRYEVGGHRFIQINNWKKHQTPHVKEPVSDIPPPPESESSTIQVSDNTHTDMSQAGKPQKSEVRSQDSAVSIQDSAVSIQDPDFDAAWALYPKRAGGNSRKDALKAWHARIAESVLSADLSAGVQRYAAYCMSLDKVNTEFVMQGQRFFGPSEQWKQEWAIPARASPNGHMSSGVSNLKRLYDEAEREENRGNQSSDDGQRQLVSPAIRRSNG